MALADGWFGHNFLAMSDANALFPLLRQSADPDAVTALERLVSEAPDWRLTHMNALDFAKRETLDEERTIAMFLHAARIGICELSWNVLCPSCGGVLGANTTLKSVRSDEYHCAFCEVVQEPTLDDMVEVSFTITPRVRAIAAHTPHMLPIWEYFRQVFFGTRVALPEDGLQSALEAVTLDGVELPAGDKAILSLQLPAGTIIVFEPVTHAAQFIEVKGEPTRERQALGLAYGSSSSPTAEPIGLRPGPLRLSLDNRTNGRTLPSIWVVSDALNQLLGRRRPFLTAKRMLSNQTFRDIYRTDIARGRPAAQDHQPHLPVHRPQGLDRALRAGRRPRRLRPGARALRHPERDRGRRRRRRGQDDRRCGDGDLPDPGSRAVGGVPHARGDARAERAP